MAILVENDHTPLRANINIFCACADSDLNFTAGTCTTNLWGPNTAYQAGRCSAEIARDFPGGEWRRIRKADGYRATIVNGAVTFEGDECSGETPGRLLRHGAA